MVPRVAMIPYENNEMHFKKFQTYRKIMDFETRLTSGFGIGLTANVRCHPPKSGPNHENGNRNGSVVSNLQWVQINFDGAFYLAI